MIKNITLPLNPFIGVTAQTGDVYDEHEYVPIFFVSTAGLLTSVNSVIAINTHSVKLANADLPPNMGGTKKPSSSGGGFFSGLLKLIFFGAVCAVGYVAWKAYQAKKGNPFDSKRF